MEVQTRWAFVRDLDFVLISVFTNGREHYTKRGSYGCAPHRLGQIGAVARI